MKNGQNKVLLIIVLVVVAFLLYRFALAPSTDLDNLIDEDKTEETENVLDVARINQEVANGTAILLDVRTDEERVTDGYAPNSTHFDVSLLEGGQLPAFSTDLKVYAHCKAGGRAEKAKVILEENGFANVVNIGGLVDWEEAGGEVVRN